MLIKFKKPDPRAGDVVQMDSSLGQQFIDRGYADLHKEGEVAATEAPEAQPAEPVADVPASKAKTTKAKA